MNKERYTEELNSIVDKVMDQFGFRFRDDSDDLESLVKYVACLGIVKGVDLAEEVLRRKPQ